MPATNIAVLYWTGSTIMWGKVVADTDAEIAAVQAFYQSDSNTSVLLLPSSQPYDDTTCRAAIVAATGKPTPDDICAVIDGTSTVVDIVKADPAMNQAPLGHTLVACPVTTARGDSYNALTKVFTNPVVVGKKSAPL